MIGIAGTRDPPMSYFHLEEERYGLGRIRSRKQFFDTFGINPITMTNEVGLCEYVRGFPSAENSMHTDFLKSLRYDKMGVDYSRITYRHKTPEHKKYEVDADELAALQARLKEALPDIPNITNSTAEQ